MKILICHNYYKLPGGEDRVFEQETELLKSKGQEVTIYTRHNDELDKIGDVDKAKKTIWNKESAEAVSQLIIRAKPDLIHCHNLFPLISPSVYWAARQAGVAVVQTLHNYRIVCPKAQLFRDGKTCMDCVGKALPLPAVIHACYRDSRMASAVVAAMAAYHHNRATWSRSVDRYITLNDFSKKIFEAGGIPAGKIAVKPHFLGEDPGQGQGQGSGRGKYLIYLGRLSEEKGVRSLLDAWRHIQEPIGLQILGDGPLADEVQHAASRDKRIIAHGQMPREAADKLLGGAMALVMPSICSETFGLSVIEAYATGTPVIAAEIGSLREIVKPGLTGFLYEAGNAYQLAETIRMAVADTDKLRAMRNLARQEYLTRYTSQTNYEKLMEIYETALSAARQ